MNKKIFIVSSTLRNNGNSERLAQEFEKGAIAGGNEVFKVNIKDMDLRFCIGCLSCLNTGKCVIQDGMNEIYDKVQNADVLVFATPIYYYEMAGQLKTFLDRLNPLYPKNNKFKSVYLLASAAENDESAMNGATTGVQGWIDCFDGVRLEGVVKAIGVNAVGEIEGNKALTKAYEIGKSL